MTFKLKSGFAVGSITVVDSNSYFQQTESAATIAPSLVLDFTSGSLDSRITYTRNSTGTYTGPNGLIKTAANNVPRFDYDPATRICKGMLIEEQRTNFLTYSEQFDNAAWGKSEGTITANTTSAPDGATTADKFVESTTSAAFHFFNQTYTKPSSTALYYTWSVYAKDAGRQLVMTLESGGSNGGIARFDLSTGTVVTSGNYGTFTNGVGQIQSVGNGWYRCSISATTGTESTVTTQISLYNISLGTNVYTGDGTSGVYVWGAQLEASFFTSSYIPTVASTVTRAQDSVMLTGNNFYSWYNQLEGTVACQFYYPFSTFGKDMFPPVYYFYGSTGNGISIYGNGGPSNRITNYGLVKDTVQQANYVDIPINVGLNKTAQGFSTNSSKFYGNGVETTEDTNVSMPNLVGLSIGSFNPANPVNWNNCITNFTYYPKRLNNATLLNLTT